MSTPETDELAAKLDADWHPLHEWYGAALKETRELSRKLERQRDALAGACNGLLLHLISHQNVHCKTVLAEDIDAVRAALSSL